jgi:hypothetical protein
MADHQEFLDLARELIANDGRLVTFGKPTTVSSDASKPWKGPGVQPPELLEPVSVYAVFLPVGSGFSLMQTDEGMFKNSEQVLLVAPPLTGEVLNDYSIIVDGGVRWKIDAMNVLAPADLTLLFAMGVSR